MGCKAAALLFLPTPPPFAGPEIFCGELLKILSSNQHRREFVYVRSNIRKENLKKGILDFEGIAAFVRVYICFVFHLFLNRPNLIYFTLASGKIGFLRDAVIIWTSAVLRRRIVVHYHGGNFHNFYGQSAGWLKSVIRVSLKLVDTVVVLGGNLGFMFEGLVPSKKIKVLYNGIDTEVYSQIHRSISNGKVTILFMGHLTYPKGFWHLIKTYRRLRERWPNAELEFAGALPEARDSLGEFLTGEVRREFETNKRKITDETLSFIDGGEQWGASYLGFVSGREKMAPFSRADIFVLPSFTEGFPMSVLEAMAAGLPVVVTPVGVLPEILKEGENCLFVRPGDVEDLEAKIEMLIKDQGLRRRMGQKNRELAMREFDIKVVAEKLVHILEETVSDRARIVSRPLTRMRDSGGGEK